jgi:hypothetical protein
VVALAPPFQSNAAAEAQHPVEAPTEQTSTAAPESADRAPGRSAGPATGVDKSVLAIAAPRRYRNRDHLRFVARQPCLICGRKPSDPHHLRQMQPTALGRKASDEFAVPLCRIHHRLVHRVGNEAAWWQDAGIDPINAARKLWEETRRAEEPVPAAPPLPSKPPVASTIPPV